MDMATVEQQYNQLQAEAQGVAQALQALAAKMQQGTEKNPDAREWLLDLKQLALNIQQEQMQVMGVMQAMHQAVQNDFMQSQNGGQWQPGYPQTPQAVNPQQQGGGFLSSLEHSGFGQALMMGAGFGIGDDIINSIF
ncbi:hypothetical protein HFQ13_10795 [Acidithiobacillus sp. VAN18-1]|uniref:Uncharacterized protein n=1 Tax=Igneacidithiobacillus copahuensis TaxID=2724909 RepID=A0AAE2YR44_9PROT|nr:hypothetical protein [Igneacidithiobacillus copahuensis]MBU2788679.1 hypothetical protein [Igneacidithiobacillus copahuensis]MBU2796637.1 hypothetical protein [Acidithiobacillus sp. VAN18-2]